MALLVAGHAALGTPDASALHTLGQIGEALLATGAAWQIRRLASTAGARYTPDRGALKQHLDELSGEPARAAVLVLLGTITSVGGEPALVTGGQAREYPEDATLPLRWIRDRLRARALVLPPPVRGGEPGRRACGLRFFRQNVEGLGQARDLTASAEVDLHRAIDLIMRGCSTDLAIQILV
jgi:hypothetical protein